MSLILFSFEILSTILWDICIIFLLPKIPESRGLRLIIGGLLNFKIVWLGWLGLGGRKGDVGFKICGFLYDAGLEEFKFKLVIIFTLLLWFGNFRLEFWFMFNSILVIIDIFSLFESILTFCLVLLTEKLIFLPFLSPFSIY